MSISFNTTHYVSGDDFVRFNPWFAVTLDDRFGNFVNSRRFRERVEDIQSNQFSTLFNAQVANSSAFAMRLEDHKNALLAARLNHIQQINQAASAKVAEIVNSGPEFTQIRQDINNTVEQRTEALLKRTDAEYRQRSAVLEQKMENVQRTQWLSFIGGVLCGGAAAVGLSSFR